MTKEQLQASSNFMLNAILYQFLTESEMDDVIGAALERQISVVSSKTGYTALSKSWAPQDSVNVTCDNPKRAVSIVLILVSQ